METSQLSSFVEHVRGARPVAAEAGSAHLSVFAPRKLDRTDNFDVKQY